MAARSSSVLNHLFTFRSELAALGLALLIFGSLLVALLR
jgi:hypothetical protein